MKLPEADGRRCAKSLSFFLRHGLAQGSYSTRDGSVPIEEVEKSLKISQDKILVSVSPEYDQDKKRQFAVLRLSHLDGSQTLTVAALGGILWQFVLPQVITFLETNHYSIIAHLFIIQVQSKTLKHLDFFHNKGGLVG